jgi:hypothetical protein
VVGLRVEKRDAFGSGSVGERLRVFRRRRRERAGASRRVTPPRETVAATVAPARNGDRNGFVSFPRNALESSTPSTSKENAPSFFGKPKTSRPAIMDRSESTSIQGQ